MRCSYGHDNIITSVRVDRLCRFRCGSCVPSESDGSFGYWSVLVDEYSRFTADFNTPKKVSSCISCLEDEAVSIFLTCNRYT
jgi:hypothetical protein